MNHSGLHGHKPNDLKLTDSGLIDDGLPKTKAADPGDNSFAHERLSEAPPHAYYRSDAGKMQRVFQGPARPFCRTRLAIDSQDEQGRCKNKNVLRRPPISQLKARMRQRVWQEAVQDVTKHTHEKPVLRRLEKLLAA